MSEITLIKSVTNASTIVSLRSDGIIQIDMNANKTLQLIDGKQIVNALAEVGGGKKYPLLFIAGDYALASPEARKYASGSEANQYTLASVFVVNNSIQKMMGNAYITFNKPITPTKIMTNQESAVAWLKTFL
jgi:hypothetical protein